MVWFYLAISWELLSKEMVNSSDSNYFSSVFCGEKSISMFLGFLPGDLSEVPLLAPTLRFLVYEVPAVYISLIAEVVVAIMKPFILVYLLEAEVRLAPDETLFKPRLILLAEPGVGLVAPNEIVLYLESKAYSLAL